MENPFATTSYDVPDVQDAQQQADKQPVDNPFAPVLPSTSTQTPASASATTTVDNPFATPVAPVTPAAPKPQVGTSGQVPFDPRQQAIQARQDLLTQQEEATHSFAYNAVKGMFDTMGKAIGYHAAALTNTYTGPLVDPKDPTATPMNSVQPEDWTSVAPISNLVGPEGWAGQAETFARNRIGKIQLEAELTPLEKHDIASGDAMIAANLATFGMAEVASPALAAHFGATSIGKTLIPIASKSIAEAFSASAGEGAINLGIKTIALESNMAAFGLVQGSMDPLYEGETRAAHIGEQVFNNMLSGTVLHGAFAAAGFTAKFTARATSNALKYVAPDVWDQFDIARRAISATNARGLVENIRQLQVQQLEAIKQAGGIPENMTDAQLGDHLSGIIQATTQALQSKAKTIAGNEALGLGSQLTPEQRSAQLADWIGNSGGPEAALRKQLAEQGGPKVRIAQGVYQQPDGTVQAFGYRGVPLRVRTPSDLQSLQLVGSLGSPEARLAQARKLVGDPTEPGLMGAIFITPEPHFGAGFGRIHYMSAEFKNPLIIENWHDPLPGSMEATAAAHNEAIYPPAGQRKIPPSMGAGIHEGQDVSYLGHRQPGVILAAREAGHDGIIVKHGNEAVEVVALDPKTVQTAGTASHIAAGVQAPPGLSPQASKIERLANRLQGGIRDLGTSVKIPAVGPVDPDTLDALLSQHYRILTRDASGMIHTGEPPEGLYKINDRVFRLSYEYPAGGSPTDVPAHLQESIGPEDLPRKPVWQEVTGQPGTTPPVDPVIAKTALTMDTLVKTTNDQDLRELMSPEVHQMQIDALDVVNHPEPTNAAETLVHNASVLGDAAKKAEAGDPQGAIRDATAPHANDSPGPVAKDGTAKIGSVRERPENLSVAPWIDPETMKELPLDGSKTPVEWKLLDSTTIGELKISLERAGELGPSEIPAPEPKIDPKKLPPLDTEGMPPIRAAYLQELDKTDRVKAAIEAAKTRYNMRIYDYMEAQRAAIEGRPPVPLQGELPPEAPPPPPAPGMSPSEPPKGPGFLGSKRMLGYRLVTASGSGLLFTASLDPDLDPRTKAMLQTAAGILGVASVVPTGSWFAHWVQENQFPYKMLKLMNLPMALRIKLGSGTSAALDSATGILNAWAGMGKSKEMYLQKLFPSVAERRAAMFALDDPYHPAWETLTGPQRDALYGEHIQNIQMGELLKKLNIIEDYRANYVRHLIPPTTYNSYVASFGPGAFTQPRTARNLQDVIDYAKRMGLPEPVMDVGIAQGWHMHEVGKAISNYMIRGELESRALLLEKGFQILPAGWKMIEGVRDMEGWMAPEPVKTAIERLAGRRADLLNDKHVQALDTITSSILQVVMAFPWVHGLNLVRAVAGMTWNPLQATKASNMLKANDPMIVQMLRDGVLLYQRTELAEANAKGFQGLLQRVGAKVPLLKVITNPTERMFQASEGALWDHWVPTTGVIAYTKHLDAWARRTDGKFDLASPEYFEARKRAAEFANDVMGKIPKIYTDPVLAFGMRQLLFAPNWLRTRLNITGKAMGDFADVLTGAKAPNEAQYLEYKIKTIATGIAFTYALSKIMTATSRGSVSDVLNTGAPPAFNPDNHKFYARTGVYDVNGKELGFDLLGWWQDDLKAFNSPTDFFLSRTSPMLGLLTSTATGRDPVGRELKAPELIAQGLGDVTGPVGNLISAGARASDQGITPASALRGAAQIGQFGNVTTLPREGDLFILQAAGKILRQVGLPDTDDRQMQLARLLKTNVMRGDAIINSGIVTWLGVEKRSYEMQSPTASKIRYVWQYNRDVLEQLGSGLNRTLGVHP